MKALYCKDCKKDSVSNCGKCRYITKFELVEIAKNKKVYLREKNRYKGGKKNALSDSEEFYLSVAHYHGESFGKIAKRYGIGKSTAHAIYHRQKEKHPKKFI